MVQNIRDRSEQFDKSALQCLYEISFNTNQEVKSHRLEETERQTTLAAQLAELRQIVVSFLESNPRIDPISQNCEFDELLALIARLISASESTNGPAAKKFIRLETISR